MQTFLPYGSFEKSAQVLDRARLGKQRVEVLQILKALTGQSKGWVAHPATLMWSGYEAALCAYGNIVCIEWRERGYKDTVLDTLAEFKFSGFRMPDWLYDERLHSSHRAALLYKDYDYYKQFGWTEQPELNYYWPPKLTL